MVGPGGGRGGYQGGYRDGAQRHDGVQRPAEPQVQLAAAEALPEDYVSAAEEVIKKLLAEHNNITNSKIRRLFSLVTPIYDKERLRTQKDMKRENELMFMMARVRMAYEAGRDKTVKNFIAKAKLMEYIKGAGGDREKFISFIHYMEALVAWHRYYGDKEN